MDKQSVPSSPAAPAVVTVEPPVAGPSTGSLPKFDPVAPVRRPVRGIQLKKETFARIGLPTQSILDSSAQPIGGSKRATRESAPGSFGYSKQYANFLLQSVSIDMEEKFQPVPTFGLTYGFFFGTRPHIYSFNAVLVDSGDFRWVNDWLGNYEKTFRGTKLTMANTPITVEFEDHVIEGYIIRSVLNKDASTPLYMQLTFNMWVTRHETPEHEAGDLRFPYSAGGTQVVHRTPFSTTDAVRRANIARLAAGGDTSWLRKIVNQVAAIKSGYDNVVQKIENFLYGRNIVPANQYVNAAKLELEQNTLDAILAGQSVTVTYKKPPYYAHEEGGFIFQNRDEYMLGGWIDALESYGSADPTPLNLADGSSVTAAYLVAQAEAAWAAKVEKQPVTLDSPTLLEKVMGAVLQRAALCATQVLLQEDGIVAITNGSVEGTMLGGYKDLKFTKDFLYPSLHTLETLAIDSVGARTVTDRLRSQAQSREQLEQQQAALAAARTAASQELDRTARLRGLQEAANAVIGTTSSSAMSEAALQEQITAVRAEERRQQQLAESERNAQREALLREFAS